MRSGICGALLSNPRARRALPLCPGVRGSRHAIGSSSSRLPRYQTPNPGDTGRHSRSAKSLPDSGLTSGQGKGPEPARRAQLTALPLLRHHHTRLQTPGGETTTTATATQNNTQPRHVLTTPPWGARCLRDSTGEEKETPRMKMSLHGWCSWGGGQGGGWGPRSRWRARPRGRRHVRFQSWRETGGASGEFSLPRHGCLRP